MEDLDFARALISRKPSKQKVALLAALTEWADTEQGRDHRAALAHEGQPSPVTAEDVFALLEGSHTDHADLLADLREDLGLDDVQVEEEIDRAHAAYQEQ